jgi:hypothetical protein
MVQDRVRFPTLLSMIVKIKRAEAESNKTKVNNPLAHRNSRCVFAVCCTSKLFIANSFPPCIRYEFPPPRGGHYSRGQGQVFFSNPTALSGQLLPIDESSYPKQCWDFLVMMCLFYTCFSVPYLLAFDTDDVNLWTPFTVTPLPRYSFASAHST